MGIVEIRTATEQDEPGVLAALTGLFAEDPGTRDPTISQDWPRVQGPSAVAAWGQTAAGSSSPPPTATPWSAC